MSARERRNVGGEMIDFGGIRTDGTALLEFGGRADTRRVDHLPVKDPLKLMDNPALSQKFYWIKRSYMPKIAYKSAKSLLTNARDYGRIFT